MNLLRIGNKVFNLDKVRYYLYFDTNQREIRVFFSDNNFTCFYNDEAELLFSFLTFSTPEGYTLNNMVLYHA